MIPSFAYQAFFISGYFKRAFMSCCKFAEPLRNGNERTASSFRENNKNKPSKIGKIPIPNIRLLFVNNQTKLENFVCQTVGKRITSQSVAKICQTNRNKNPSCTNITLAIVIVLH